MDAIPFNKPYLTGRELHHIAEASFNNNMLSGDGPFTKHCHTWIEEKTYCKKALLTHSCTAALEMAALLLDVKPGDEIIMPSYTFVSTANAFVLRGAVPVFVDIREDTLNLNEDLVEGAVTARTRAIVPVHYAGVGCEMDKILSVAARHGLMVVEDAAQGLMAKYKGKFLGSIGDLGTYSFHETKNIISGEGGAILVRDSKFAQRAEIIREKGTNRSQFLRGESDKYTWQDLGSSFLPSEIIAAFLWAQMEEAEQTTNARLVIWNNYNEILKPLELKGLIRRPIVPEWCQHNAHMYYILLEQGKCRYKVLEYLRGKGVFGLSHYVPLHSSPAGQLYARISGEMKVTQRRADELIRLPLWLGLSTDQQTYIADTLSDAIAFS